MGIVRGGQFGKVTIAVAHSRKLLIRLSSTIRLKGPSLFIELMSLFLYKLGGVTVV